MCGLLLLLLLLAACMDEDAMWASHGTRPEAGAGSMAEAWAGVEGEVG